MKVFDIGEHHGQPEYSRRVGGVHFALTRRGARTTVAEHCHTTATFIALIGGQHHWTSNEGKIRWSLPGIWYFRPPMLPHTHEACPTDIRSLGIQFPIELSPALASHTDAYVLDHAIGRSIIDDIAENLSAKDAGSDHALLGSFHRLIAAYLRHKRPLQDQNVRQWLASARQWLDEHYLEPVQLATCANAIGSHPSHLARAFRAAFGQTVGDYIRDRRLEWAFDQLRKNDRKVSEIAVSAGFADHAHFSRVFKERYGKPPSDYRLRDPEPAST
ncbi:MAG: helix-turn-helix transcriptional regulator [Fimbriimonadaceae bacterium]|nr:helix-turn-helix transcriptional regulator [Fimbriimonadaceae bacterium]